MLGHHWSSFSQVGNTLANISVARTVCQLLAGDSLLPGVLGHPVMKVQPLLLSRRGGNRSRGGEWPNAPDKSQDLTQDVQTPRAARCFLQRLAQQTSMQATGPGGEHLQAE